MIVRMYRHKNHCLAVALSSRRGRRDLGRRLRQKESGAKRIKILDIPAPRIDMHKIAKALGADTCIPLEWVQSFWVEDNFLVLIFGDNVEFEIGDGQLLFKRYGEEAYIAAELVRKVCQNDGSILWSDRRRSDK